MALLSNSNLKNLFIIIYFVISFLNVNAQVTQEWVARYNSTTNNSETPIDLALDSTGNIYVTGRDDLGPPGFVTLSYDNSGNFRWATRYVGMQFFVAQPRKIGTDINNNVYVIADDVSYILIKYDSNGNEEWVRRFGMGSNSSVSDMVIDEFGNVIVTGTVDGDIKTIKYTSTGDTVWIKVYDEFFEIAGYMDINDKGDIAIVGTTQEDIGQYNDIITLKYDSSGNLVWNKRFFNPKAEYVYDVTFDNKGNVISTGFSLDSVWHNEDYFTLKYFHDGSFSWFKEYGRGNAQIDIAEHIAADGNGNIIVTGKAYNLLPYHAIFETTVKYDSSGNEQWVRQFRGANDSTTYVEDLKVDSQGNIYTTGSYDINFSGTKRGMYLLRRSYNSNIDWQEFYNGPSMIDGGVALELDKENNIYACGTSADSSGGSNDILIIKYSQSTGINLSSGEIPKSYSLSQNYPNPFNSQTKIRFSIPKSGDIKLELFDVLGRSVGIIFKKYIKAGQYETVWDAGQLTTGIYFYQLQSKDFTDTKKMVLVK